MSMCVLDDTKGSEVQFSRDLSDIGSGLGALSRPVTTLCVLCFW